MMLKNSIHINGFKSFLNTSCRCIQSQVETRPLPANDLLAISPENKKLLVNKIKSELSSFFERDKFLKADVSNIKIPASFFTVKSNSNNVGYSFIIDDGAARKIVSCIQPHILEDNSVIIEANPGIGLITNHLLAAGVRELQVCQNKNLFPHFQNLVSCNHPRVCLNLGDAFHKWKYEEHNTLAYINCIHKKISERNKDGSNENVKLKVISVEHMANFFPSVCRSIINGKWHCYEDVEFYTIVREDTMHDFLGDTAKKQQKIWVHIVFHLLMNCQKLCELPRISFLPWTKHDKQSMYLMRIYKKPNAFNIIQREEFKDFYKFLQIIGSSKFNYIIPTLEHWSPGCGVHLIKGGIPMWKQVVDLTCEEAAHLYKLFQSAPEYENYKEILNGSILELVEENEEKISEML